MVIFGLALGLRLYGVNWDQGHHLHPDERFLTMVSSDIVLPSSLTQYFNTATSPLNPYNYSNYQFFVYGTFPIFLTKFFAVILGMDGYDRIYLLGRILSAVFDSLNIIFLYLLTKKHLPSLLYAFCVLPLQLSHFYAVDTFLATTLLATFTFLHLKLFPFAAFAFGLSLATKISAIYFAPIIAVFIIYKIISTKKTFSFLLIASYCLLITFFVYRIFQPYAFTGMVKLNPQFLDNIQQLQRMARPDGNFPPSVQWLSKTPLTNSLQNIILWGVGVPGILVFLLSLLKLKKSITPIYVLSLLWILLLYFYQGSQFAHTMRYFLPLYPFICLLAGSLIVKNKFILKILVIGHMAFGILFLSIYSRPHSRVQASQWIYQNIPSGSQITNEYWDDPMPLYLPGFSPYVYQGEMLSLYDPDSPEKWDKINPQINQADFLIMSSNRLWGSIPLVPDKYPQTAQFYRDLFAGKLDFKKTIEINSYPGINLPFMNSCVYFGPANFPGMTNSWFTVDRQCLYPGIFIRDDIAEEAFTVYDHPKVLIFGRKN